MDRRDFEAFSKGNRKSIALISENIRGSKISRSSYHFNLCCCKSWTDSYTFTGIVVHHNCISSASTVRLGSAVARIFWKHFVRLVETNEPVVKFFYGSAGYVSALFECFRRITYSSRQWKIFDSLLLDFFVPTNDCISTNFDYSTKPKHNL
jgi:hypothetical protein